MRPTGRLRLSRTHRLLGMLATVPVVCWIASSFVLHGVGLALPNGLQGVYDMRPSHAGGTLLEDPSLVEPSVILEAVGDAGLDRIYWLRLEEMGGEPLYVVKPGPQELEWSFDARTGRRVDPLPIERLRAVADDELTGTRAASIVEEREFNRYYTVDRVPSVTAVMEGDQPSEIVLSRASGRTLRRTDALAAWFHAAYLSVHVWQWGDRLGLFTALLYGLVFCALVLVGLGYTLWWTRRESRKRWSSSTRRARRVHGRLAPVAGLLLATQMLVGAYLWYNLGLIEPRFRGQGSFAAEWSGGIAVTESLAPAHEMVRFVPDSAIRAGVPIQRFEWRGVGPERFWLAYPDRNVDGVLLEAPSGRLVGRLSPERARIAGEMVVDGSAVGPPVESTEYWMDFNARVPTYRFRFSDRDDTDVHVSQVTGEVVQRRPAIWRAFGPFLAYHTFAFTGNPWFDTVLLTLLQLTVLTMVVSGWRLALRSSKSPDPTTADDI